MLSQHNIVLGKQRRIAALDVGTRYIGVAISDTTQCFALPHAVWEWAGDWARLEREVTLLLEQYKISHIVLGKQEVAHHAHTVMDLVAEVAKVIAKHDIDVALESEYVSTVEAKNRAADVGMTGRLDDVAAQIILERYLASCKNASL